MGYKTPLALLSERSVDVRKILPIFTDFSRNQITERELGKAIRGPEEGSVRTLDSQYNVAKKECENRSDRYRLYATSARAFEYLRRKKYSYGSKVSFSAPPS